MPDPAPTAEERAEQFHDRWCMAPYHACQQDKLCELYTDALAKIRAAEQAATRAASEKCLKIIDQYAEKEQADHLQFHPYSSPLYYAKAAGDAIRALAEEETNHLLPTDQEPDRSSQ